MVSVSLNLTHVNLGVFDRTGIKDQQKIAKKKIKKPQTAIELRHKICFFVKVKKTPLALTFYRVHCLLK